MEWLANIDINIAAPQNGPDNFVYHYQSLIAGLLALVAGGAPAFFLWLQSRRLNRRRLNSALSRLPLALSDLHGYADSCLLELSRLMARTGEFDDIRNPIRIPHIPEDALNTLTEMIESSADSDAQFFQALLRRLQIQNSRIQRTAIDVSPERPSSLHTGTYNLRHDVLDAFVIKTMADHLFPFARREVGHVPPYSAPTDRIPGLYLLHTHFDSATNEYVAQHLGRVVERAFKDPLSEG